MRELRIHGRGGQGAVIASKLLASALFREANKDIDTRWGVLERRVEHGT